MKAGKVSHHSEFNMGQMDFIRHDTILRKADEMQCQSILFSKVSVLGYYAAVRNLFMNLKPIFVQNRKLGIVKTLKNNLDTIYDKLMEWNAQKNKMFPTELYKAIEDTHSDLLNLRQEMGIGIVMLKKYADKTIIRKHLHVSKIRI